MTTTESTTLTPVGGRFALMIDDATLESLGIDATTPLRVQTDGRSLVISKLTSDPVTDEEFKASLRKMNQRYEATFRKLAE